MIYLFIFSCSSVSVWLSWISHEIFRPISCLIFEFSSFGVLSYYLIFIFRLDEGLMWPHNTLLTIRGHFFSLPLFSALSFSAFLLSQQVKFLIYFFWGVESLPFLISFALFCTFFFNLYYSSLSLSFWWYFFAIYSLSSLAIAAAPFTIFLHSLSFLWPLLCTFLFLYSNFLLF